MMTVTRRAAMVRSLAGLGASLGLTPPIKTARAYEGEVRDNLRVNTDTPLGVLGRVHTRWIQFLDEEETETPAGTFACDRYAFGDASRIWVHSEDRMPARLRFAEMDREFVLSEWQPWT